MDRAEIARRVERAEKLLQKGKTSEALDEYLQVLAEDPQNDNVRQMAADICLSLQRTAEAVKLLGELFERQIAAGENTRASLTYKKLARYTVPTSIQRVQFGQILETSNRKLALETYESALEDLSKNGRQQDCLMVLRRLVVLEPAERNFLRLGELCSQTGDKAGAAAAFLKLAEMTEASGANAAQWFERAYTEDSTDPKIALGYGKSLIAQGQVGAAIFVLEPLAKVKDASLETRETYVKALLSANRLSDAEPLVWELFKANPSRQQEVADLIGLLVDAAAGCGSGCAGAQAGTIPAQSGRPPRFCRDDAGCGGQASRFARSSGVHERVVQCLQSGRRLLPDSAQAFRSALRHGQLCQGRRMPGSRC